MPGSIWQAGLNPVVPMVLKEISGVSIALERLDR